MHGTRCTCTTNPLILIVIPHDTVTVRAHIAQEDPDVRTGSLLYRGSALSSRQPMFRPSTQNNLTTHAQGGTSGWPTKTRGTWPNRSIYAYGVIARRARNEGKRTAVVLRRPVFERTGSVKCAIWRAPHARTLCARALTLCARALAPVGALFLCPLLLCPALHLRQLIRERRGECGW